MGALDLWRTRQRPGYLFKDFWDLMDEPFGKEWSNQMTARMDLNPACDVTEDDGAYKLIFDLPGMEEKDIEIEIAGNQLRVSGERKHEFESDEGEVHRVERSYGKFQRFFALPEGVNPEAIEANYDKGVLTIGLPKEATKKTHKVEIGKKEGFLKRLTHAGESKETKE